MRIQSGTATNPSNFWLLWPALSFLILAAHALRIGQTGMALALAGLPVLFFTRQAWVRFSLTVLLFGGALLWSDIAAYLIRTRLEFNAPWIRPAIIMGSVFLLTLFSALLLAGKKGCRFFAANREHSVPLTVIFLLSVLLLSLIQVIPQGSLLLLERYAPGFGWIEILFLGFYATWVGQNLLELTTAPRTRSRIWSLFSFVFFLQLLLGILGMERMLMTGELHLPVPALILAGPLSRGEGFFMVILFLVTVALVGPAWCSHLCYIGAWDDRISRLSRKKVAFPWWATPVRWGLLLLAVGSPLLLRFVGFQTAAAIWAAALFGLGGLLVMVLGSARTGNMVHCSVYCPMGLFANLLGRFHPWKIRIGKQCTRCGKCFRQCRYGALRPEQIGPGGPGFSCTLCGDCIPACPHGQIGYSFPGLDPVQSHQVFISMIVILHVLFLAVARI